MPTTDPLLKATYCSTSTASASSPTSPRCRASRARSRSSTTRTSTSRARSPSRKLPGQAEDADGHAEARPHRRHGALGLAHARSCRATPDRRNGSVDPHEHASAKRSLRYNFTNAMVVQDQPVRGRRDRQRRADRGSDARLRDADQGLGDDHVSASSSRRPASCSRRRRERAPTASGPSSRSSCPRGYVDGDGTVHRDGVMRLATARDEIIPQRDPRVRENEAYLTVLLLSRVVTRLGTLTQVHTGRHRGPVRLRPRVPPGPLPPDQPGGPHPGGGHLPVVQPRVHGRRGG